MSRRVQIPIRVQEPVEHQPTPPVHSRSPDQGHGKEKETQPVQTRPAAEPQQSPTSEKAQEAPPPSIDSEAEVQEWRDRALRLQAEMENFRKRQQRLAQQEIDAERQRLLSAFLRVVDDLERALEAPATDREDIRRGVQVTHSAALQLLQHEGVEKMQALGEPFDPTWHEAVATTASNHIDASPNTVAHVMEPGYRIGDQLLRPTKVVVAV
jgi:molecular chaperone GrpE